MHIEDALLVLLNVQDSFLLILNAYCTFDRAVVWYVTIIYYKLFACDMYIFFNLTIVVQYATHFILIYFGKSIDIITKAYIA